MTEREHELLNRFLDDELADEDRPEFEQCLRANAELAVMRDDFAAIGAMLREHIAVESEAMDFSGFMVGIDARIDAQEALPAAAVAEPEAVRPVQPSRDEGMLDRVQNWWRQNWAPLALGAAAAAAIIIYVAQPSKVTTNQGRGHGAVANVQPGGDVVVDSISNEGTKTVLVSMPAENGESTVIWLLDGEVEEQGPVEGEDPI